MHASPPSDENMQSIHSLENKIVTLLRKDEVVCLQQSRVNWMVEGDKNTCFFIHRVASERKRRNHISKIRDDDGTAWEEEEYIERVFQRYFAKLFTAKDDIDMNEPLMLWSAKSQEKCMMNWWYPLWRRKLFRLSLKCIPRNPRVRMVCPIFYQKN